MLLKLKLTHYVLLFQYGATTEDKKKIPSTSKENFSMSDASRDMQKFFHITMYF